VEATAVVTVVAVDAVDAAARVVVADRAAADAAAKVAAAVPADRAADARSSLQHRQLRPRPQRLRQPPLLKQR
jgi:hypothetical protein